MIEKLKEMQKNCYVPISNFRVSSCVVTKDDKYYYGVNVEDSSTRAGSCAERVALFNAITAGVKKEDIKEVHVLTSSKRVGTPCFVCRQMFTEYLEDNCKIICYSLDGEKKEFTKEELCPYPFEEEDLQ